MSSLRKTISAAADPPPSTGGTGFSTRPFFFQPDEARLRGYITANNPWAIGNTGNNSGQPLGFMSLMNLVYQNRTPQGYGDVPIWNVAVYAWLSGNTAAATVVRNEVMAGVNALPGGYQGTSDPFQRSDDTMFQVCIPVDCCYSAFSDADRAAIATYINGTQDNWVNRNLNYWPFDNTHNNYWQNGLLAMVAAGICSQGWNPRADEWLTRAKSMAVQYLAGFAPGVYTGPHVAEGNYYSAYVKNSDWALRLLDLITGTTYSTTLAASRTPDDELNFYLYQLLPSRLRLWNFGDEPGDSTAPTGHTNMMPHYYQLMFRAGPSSPTAQVAKTVIATGEANYTWARSSKAFQGFYWNTTGITAAAASTKTDRFRSWPSPGPAVTTMRSASGWDTTGRAMIIFHRNNDESHAHHDSPGFQWAEGDELLATDPNYFSRSGTRGQAGGEGAILANCVSFSVSDYPGSSGSFPQIVFAEDNIAAAVPHYYVSVNAQPYWSQASTYRREYVVLDDLRVLVIFDRIVTAGANSKIWRYHVPGVPSIAGNTVTIPTTGGRSVRLIDLYSTSSPAWAAVSAVDGDITGTIYRISQTDAANDYRSLKIIDVGGRATSPSLTSGAGFLQANITIGGVARTVKFYDNGTHAEVA